MQFRIDNKEYRDRDKEKRKPREEKKRIQKRPQEKF